MTKEIQNFPTNNLKYFFLETSESHWNSEEIVIVIK